MGLGNKNSNYGNKGSNYKFQLAVLKLLERIKKAV